METIDELKLLASCTVESPIVPSMQLVCIRKGETQAFNGKIYLTFNHPVIKVENEEDFNGCFDLSLLLPVYNDELYIEKIGNGLKLEGKNIDVNIPIASDEEFPVFDINHIKSKKTKLSFDIDLSKALLGFKDYIAAGKSIKALDGVFIKNLDDISCAFYTNSRSISVIFLKPFSVHNDVYVDSSTIKFLGDVDNVEFLVYEENRIILEGDGFKAFLMDNESFDDFDIKNYLDILKISALMDFTDISESKKLLIDLLFNLQSKVIDDSYIEIWPVNEEKVTVFAQGSKGEIENVFECKSFLEESVKVYYLDFLNMLKLSSGVIFTDDFVLFTDDKKEYTIYSILSYM